MSPWIDSYVSENFSVVGKVDYVIGEKLSNFLKEIIGRCSTNEKELNPQNFKKLEIIVINEYCFKKIELKKNLECEYMILLPQRSTTDEDVAWIKHEIAHEIAHFLFSLQGRKFNNDNYEQIECNRKAKEWSFPKPEEKK